MKARYMTYFSYLGTKFRSSAKVKEVGNTIDTKSIQGQMERALLNLKPINYPDFILSSRTDGGVHALNSSGHFDLVRRGEDIYDPTFVITRVNRFFVKNNLDIFVRSCTRVKDNFNARYNACSRTYLYRLAILKPGTTFEKNFFSIIPIEEWQRCYFLKYLEFDIERLKEGAKYFVGYHDFTTFRKYKKTELCKNNRRTMMDVTVKPGVPCLNSFTLRKDNPFDYWDIEIKGRSFVHNQIRRMVSTLISVAIGRLKPEDIKVMLQIPSKHSWHPCVDVCPPDGLYLCNVEYKPDDLVYTPESYETRGTLGNNSDSE